MHTMSMLELSHKKQNLWKRILVYFPSNKKSFFTDHLTTYSFIQITILMDATQLFTNAPTGVVSVFTTVFKIFGAHWKPLLLLASIQIVSFLVVFLILGLISFGFLATYMVAIAAAMSKASDGLGGNGRHLIDHAFFSGTSRLLQQNNDYYDGFDDFSELFDAKFFIIVAILYVLWIVTVSLVSSLFLAAFVHAIADIYAGNVPSINRSINYATTRMWSVYCFQLLVSLVVTVGLLVTIGIPVIANIPDFKHPGLLFIGILVSIIAVMIFSSSMVAGVPSIVIERKSDTEAFGRSWELCKNYICFIFCTLFCINSALIISGALANSIFDQLPGLFALTGHIIVNLISMSLSPILIVVIYMSVRVQSENLTQEEMILAIGDRKSVV